MQHRYAIVQVHNLPDFLVFAALIPKLTGARVILDLHDLMPEFFAERREQPMSSLPVRIVLWQERLSCRFADHVITVTDLWREALIKRGVPADKVAVVMNVADDRIFRQVTTHSASDRDGAFRLIYHGTLARRYGLDIALRALSIVRESIRDIHLTIHGNGEYRSELEELVDELRLQDCVEFSSRFVPTDELPGLLMKADLGIVPYREGVFTGGILPTKLMEYAALGIPAIAARTPAISAYFDDTMVSYFAPGDVEDLARRISELYRNWTRLAELTRNVQQFTQRYNWTTEGSGYVALVERLRN
jgi:glycosyltransferase involved in cell wall biosynthesis